MKLLMGANLNNRPIKYTKNSIRSSFQDKLPKLPKPQNIYCCNSSAELKYESTLTTAEDILPNINPIIKMVIASLTFVETIKTVSKTKKLPKVAAMTMLHFDAKTPRNMPPKSEAPMVTNATPKLAPEVMPSTKGPASGFLNNVCTISPEIPRPEPTIIAVNAFGNL